MSDRYEWTIRLHIPDENDPFHMVDCEIIDVGYSDKCYIVECSGFNARIAELEAENAELRKEVDEYKRMIAEREN